MVADVDLTQTVRDVLTFGPVLRGMLPELISSRDGPDQTFGPS